MFLLIDSCNGEGEGLRGNKEINQPVLGVYEEAGMKKDAKMEEIRRGSG